MKNPKLEKKKYKGKIDGGSEALNWSHMNQHASSKILHKGTNKKKKKIIRKEKNEPKIIGYKLD